MTDKFNINNISEEGVTNEEQFTEEEKATQIVHPEDDSVFRVNMPENSAGKKLSNKQILFCKYYVATGDIRRSATLAGYGNGKSLKTVAGALKMNPDVSAYIAELTEKKLEQEGYTKDQLIKTLAIISQHRVKDYVDISTETRTSKAGNEYEAVDIKIKDLDEIDKAIAIDEYGFPLEDENGNPIYVDSGKSLAIKSINYTDSGKIKLELYDRMQAIDKLTKMMGVDGKQQIEINNNVKIESTKKSLMDKLMKKLGNEPEVEVAAEENEWFKQQQREKELAEQEQALDKEDGIDG